jgi:hypothetical protein
LRAHQIGTATRIARIGPFAYVLVHFEHADRAFDFLLAGTHRLLLILAFESIGSFVLRRPVHEILEGWHVENGYSRPYVLLSCFLSSLVVGLLVGPKRLSRHRLESGEMAD